MRDCAADAVFRIRFRKSGFLPKIGPGDMRREEAVVGWHGGVFPAGAGKNRVSMAGRKGWRFAGAG